LPVFCAEIIKDLFDICRTVGYSETDRKHKKERQVTNMKQLNRADLNVIRDALRNLSSQYIRAMHEATVKGQTDVVAAQRAEHDRILAAMDKIEHELFFGKGGN
jgi:hypothetical protein